MIQHFGVFKRNDGQVFQFRLYLKHVLVGLSLNPRLSWVVTLLTGQCGADQRRRNCRDAIWSRRCWKINQTLKEMK